MPSDHLGTHPDGVQRRLGQKVLGRGMSEEAKGSTGMVDYLP